MSILEVVGKINSMGSEGLVMLWNSYCEKNNLDSDMIYSTEEINDIFKNYSPKAILAECRRKDFNVFDKFMKKDGYGNWHTTNYALDFIDVNEMLDYMLESEDDLDVELYLA